MYHSYRLNRLNTFNLRFWIPLIVLILANVLIVIPLPISFTMIGAMVLFFVLPGWVFLEAWFPHPTDLAERLIVAIGLAFAISLTATLYLIYMPGELNLSGLLIAINLWIILWQMVAFWRKDLMVAIDGISWRVWGPVTLMFVVALLIRMPLMDYSEFHEDEVEVVSLAARILGGEDYAIFLHRKGPIQTLVPLLLWLTSNSTIEWVSRLPFMLASTLGVVVVYLFTRRLVGSWAALIAGGLMAVNGLSVAFGRMVQYQAIILFLGPLAVWLMWLAWQARRYGYIVLGAVLLAVCTLAHYDTLLYYPVVVYLAWKIWRDAADKRRAMLWLAGGVLAAGIMLASFYVPYIIDPQFQHTLNYLAGDRIGDEWLYNNLRLLQRLDTDYSSWLYLPLLIILTTAFTLGQSQRWLTRLGWIVLMMLAVSAYLFRDWWKIDAWDIAILPWLVALVWGIRADWGSKTTVWVWWLTSFIGYTFLVDRPFTHFYIMYPAWAIIAGLGAEHIRIWLSSRRVGWVVFWGVATALAIILSGYQMLLFWQTDTAYQNRVTHWQAEPLSWLYGEIPEPYSYFGAPRQLGWKVAGQLMLDGTLAADYRTANELFSVPVWYATQRPRSCFDDPAVYFVANPNEGMPDVIQSYTLNGRIMVEGQPRIAVFTRQPQADQPASYQLSDFKPRFDAQASPTRFVGLPMPQTSLLAHFGNVINLRGFTLSTTHLVAGDTLHVTLQWETTNPIEIPYRAFVHLEKDGQIWAQHDDDPACRFPTNLWRPGQLTQGQFRLTLKPDTPPGSYPLTIGLYHPETWERLPRLDENGNPLSDYMTLTTITVTGAENQSQ